MTAMAGRIDAIEPKSFALDAREYFENASILNKLFPTSVEASNGFFGESTRVKDNGVLEKTTKDLDGHYHKEYYDSQGKLFQIKESLGDHKVKTIDVDSTGTAYASVTRQTIDNKARIIDYSLAPNTTIVKENVVAVTDSYGRPVSNKVTDLQYNPAKNPGGSKFRNSSYLDGDQGGHLIPHQFGGAASPENIVAQNGKSVNQGKFAQVEHLVKDLKDQGHSVDYEVKTNYIGSDKRPSSFEPKITVDGVDHPLPDDLKKIYNDADVSSVKKAVTDIGEKHGLANEAGIKSGLVAAGITFAVSTVDNVSAFVDGEITAEEMVVDIVTETTTAGVIEYGAEFISATASQAMSKSSSALVQRVAGSSLPAAVVSFAVESYDSVSSYAKGEIDGAELAYELGENATSVAGAMKGASIGAAVGSVAGPVGTVAGGIVGGVVGAVVATEVYATAVELGAEGAEKLAEQAESLMKGTVELFEEHVPDKVTEVKDAFSDYISSFNLPFNL